MNLKINPILLTRIAMVVFVLLALSNTVSAQLPPGEPVTLDELDKLIRRVTQFVLVISVLLAVIFIVRAGVTYMYAGADATKVGEAQAQLKSGIIGALIVLGVGVIINTLASLVTREFFCQLSIGRVCIIP